MRGIIPFLLDAWRLARPYYGSQSEERWSARGLLSVYIALRLLDVGINVIYSFWNNAFFTAVQERNWDTFIHLLLWGKRVDNSWLPGFTLFAMVAIAMAVLRIYIAQLLQIRWRRWMTARFLNAWLAPDRAYYRISLKQGTEGSTYTDNPDQRIAEDLRDFIGDSVQGTAGILFLGIDLLSNLVNLASFIAILWSLSGSFQVLGVGVPGFLVWVALIYAVLGTGLTHLVGRKLVPLNFNKQRVEADFRFALMRVRENTEGIALYGGEEEEKRVLRSRFSALAGNWRQLMTRYKYLTALTSTYGQLAVVFPWVVGAAPYFAKLVEFGVLTQTVNAFGQVQGGMSWFVDSYANLANWRATVERLTKFYGAIEAARAAAFEGVHAEGEDGGCYALHDATVMLPDGQKLLERVNLNLKPGEPILVTGRSGAGKSTLFRAFAGIWPFGSGGVQRAHGRTLFLPQQPYIPLGSLRRAVTYPSEMSAFSDAEVRQALVDAQLGYLADRLDEEDNWSMRLSGGEQQRLAMARALLTRPDWLFLDEATSSLDAEAEAAVYQAIRRRLPNTTVVSIAHHTNLGAWHPRHLVVQREPGQTGQILEADLQAAD